MSWCLRPIQHLYHSCIYSLIEMDRERSIPARNQNCPTVIFLAFLWKRKIRDKMITCWQKPCQILWRILKYFFMSWGFYIVLFTSIGFFTAMIHTAQLKITSIGLWPLNVILYVMKACRLRSFQCLHISFSLSISFKDVIDWGEKV